MSGIDVHFLAESMDYSAYGLIVGYLIGRLEPVLLERWRRRHDA